MDENRENGILGEDLALYGLEARGYTLLARNYRAERCEIDLVMQDCGVIAFIEVKARHKSAFGTGREAVDRRKQGNIIKAASAYLIQHGLMDEFVRFDVAEVDLDTRRVIIIKNAFTA